MTRVANPFALFDTDDGGTLRLTGYRRTIVADACGTGQAGLPAAFAAIEAAVHEGAWVALALDYDAGPGFDAPLAACPGGRPGLRAWVFDGAAKLDAQATAAFLQERVAALPEWQRVAGIADVVPSLDAAAYRAKVERIRRWITDGDCYQVNLTFPIDFTAYGHPLALYARLRERQPVRYGGCLLTPDRSILSFSPELFFERTGTRVTTQPMKGTAPRGATPAEDAARRAALLASAKERAENLMIVDLLRNDLGRLAEPRRVRVDALFDVEPYPTLWQMVSTVSAELPEVPLFDVFRALFPCGSITGAPKIRATQRIAELEEAPRGLYTGALGWLAPGGDCRFNVAIRTLTVRPDGGARLGVGSGIVIDADAGREYAECLLKAKFVTGFNPGFQLIETMRFEQGRIDLLPLHLERLRRSARALGFACDVPAIDGRLADLGAVLARDAVGQVLRVRFTLAHDGSVEVTHAALPVDTRFWQATLANETIDPVDYLLRHKTTARSRYDRALSGLQATPEVFDVIFCNARGEVCEGACSNVFIERDGILLTPPERCGLLPGVMRRHLLDRGLAVERILSRDDLLKAPAVYLANALRGLFRVTLRR